MNETYERNGCKVTIDYDDTPENPREWDNVGVMFCSHRNYTLGDEQMEPEEFEGWKDVEQYLRKERKAAVVLPLYLYDHSGITMYTVGNTDYHQHEAWDSGQVGFIYCTQEDVDREWNGDLKAAELCLIGEVKTYDKYLTGEVYGFSVESLHGEDVDSCWGFYDLDDCKAEANDAADSFVHPHDAKFAKNASHYHG